MVHHAGDQTGAPTSYPDSTNLAAVTLDFEFFGKPAHAAGDPYNGVNAVNAVVKLFTGIDALRQHVTMDARFHGIITHGGDAANVVPHYAAAQFIVRAASRDYLEELVEKVRNIARGAALITGCELKISSQDTYYDMRPSYAVGRQYLSNMKEVGLEIKQRPSGRGMYSSDFGNVSYLLPAVTGSFAISREPIPGHSQQVVDASGSEFGYDQLIKVSKAMALTAFDLMTDADLLTNAKVEHENWPPKG
jgi:metal-dependent amidase/aminoacylase/carboxypeptidase family protein